MPWSCVFLTALLPLLLLTTIAASSGPLAQSSTSVCAQTDTSPASLVLQDGLACSGVLDRRRTVPLGPQVELRSIGPLPANCAALGYGFALYDGEDHVYYIPKSNPCFVRYNTTTRESELLFTATDAMRSQGAISGAVYDRQRHRVFLIPIGRLPLTLFSPRVPTDVGATLTEVAHPPLVATEIAEASDMRYPFGGGVIDETRQKLWIAGTSTSTLSSMSPAQAEDGTSNAAVVAGGMPEGHRGYQGAAPGALGCGRLLFDGRRTVYLIPWDANAVVACDTERRSCVVPPIDAADGGGRIALVPPSDLDADGYAWLAASAYMGDRVVSLSSTTDRFIVLHLAPFLITTRSTADTGFRFRIGGNAAVTSGVAAVAASGGERGRARSTVARGRKRGVARRHSTSSRLCPSPSSSPELWRWL